MGKIRFFFFLFLFSLRCHRQSITRTLTKKTTHNTQSQSVQMQRRETPLGTRHIHLSGVCSLPSSVFFFFGSENKKWDKLTNPTVKGEVMAPRPHKPIEPVQVCVQENDHVITKTKQKREKNRTNTINKNMRGGGLNVFFLFLPFLWFLFQSVGRTRFSCGFVSNNRFIFKLLFFFF